MASFCGWNHKKPIQTFRPYNIAHRGSNGELPEETEAAYLRAIEDGADFIETDVLASKDGHLICSHDVILDTTTDVANHSEFANRKRSYVVQGFNVTGWRYEIITFEEFILIALYANRVVGIYPEIKNPIFINQHSYYEITSDSYLAFIRATFVGIGPSKDSIVPPKDNYLGQPTDLVARAHALNLQVHPYTFRNENSFLHFDFHQDPYAEYEYWLNEIGVDGLFTYSLVVYTSTKSGQ
ncbi:hypothetical protein HU200_048321 [Digitaria exilis]|uniref:glycerophosphodiester phosphodiesterase n=1 Tax=Digitaria exilis TaxID=1010633 RepID=A0A835B1F5_9POAL|nr:hypothetical protein HU200_048321 [Digitaria exilis]